MKRLLSILVALLFVSGMAMAQNSSTTDQDGVNNSANVTQILDGGDNTSNVEQYGGDDPAFPNLATVNQTTSNTGKNESGIKQGNQVNGNADLMDAYVNQIANDGGWNYSYIHQVNNAKNATVNQTAGGSNSKNESFIEQSIGGINEPISSATVNQYAWNEGYNKSEIYQAGKQSDANVYQRNWGYGDDGITSYINQNGYNQSADVDQYHAGTGKDESTINQAGGNNAAELLQMAINVGGTNASDIGQYGGENGGNTAKVHQNITNLGDNTANVMQGKEAHPNADQQWAWVNQNATSGGSNEATVEQVNNSHWSQVLQHAAANSKNTSTIYQGGHSPKNINGGWISLNQVAILGGENTSNINQHATNTNYHLEETYATVIQTSSGGINQVDIDQYDMYNWANINQFHTGGGLMNNAFIEQKGNGPNIEMINQTGSGNTANTIQHNY